MQIQIVDQENQAVRGLNMSLNAELPDARRRGLVVVPWARLNFSSDANGLVDSGSLCLAAGEWVLAVSEFKPAQEQVLKISANQTLATKTLILQVPHADLIEGVLQSEGGQALGKQTMQLSYDDLQGRRVFYVEHTLADGFFRLQRRGKLVPKELHVVDIPDYQDLHLPGPLPWGRSDLRLVMQKMRGPESKLHLQVVAAETGHPVEQYGLRFYISPWRDDPLQRPHAEGAGEKVILQGRHEAGQVDLPCLLGSTYALTVYPEDKSLACNGIAFVDTAATGDTQFTLQLYPLVSQSVRVLHGDGRPVSGCKVQLLRQVVEIPDGSGRQHVMRGAKLLLKDARLAKRGSFRMSGLSISRSVSLVYDEGLTDKEGRVLLMGPADGQPMDLMAQSDEAQPAKIEGVQLQKGAAEVLMTVMTSAKVSVQLQPKELWQRLSPQRKGRWQIGHLRLRSAKTGYEFPAGTNEGEVSVDGNIQIKDVSPGTYDISLSFRMPPTYYPQWAILGPEWEIGEGEQRDMVVDISHLVPASFAGRAMVNGKPVVEGDLTLRRYRPMPSGTNPRRGKSAMRVDIPVQTDSLGAFRMENLIPGEYEVILKVMQGRRQYPVSSQSKFMLAPGENRHELIVYSRTEAKVQLQAGAADISLAYRQVVWQARTGQLQKNGTGHSDAEGMLFIPDLRAGEWHFTLSPDRSQVNLLGGKAKGVSLGTLFVPEGLTEFTAELKVPGEELSESR